MKAERSYSRFSAKIFKNFTPIFQRADLGLVMIPAYRRMPKNPGDRLIPP
jgi:hypothetical protein